MKGLYHYTSTYHLLNILQTGHLKLTDGLWEDKAVWLTTSKTQSGNGLEGSIVDKGEIRFILKDIPAIKWGDYKKKFIKGKDKKEIAKWAKALESDQNPSSWWLSSQIITLDQIDVIENSKTGKFIKLPSSIDEILREII